jgi:hypothetical protein
VPRVEPVGDDVLRFTDAGLGDDSAHRFQQWRTRGERGLLGGHLPIRRQANPDQHAVVVGTVRAPGRIAALSQCEAVPSAVHGAVHDRALVQQRPEMRARARPSDQGAD